MGTTTDHALQKDESCGDSESRFHKNAALGGQPDDCVEREDCEAAEQGLLTPRSPLTRSCDMILSTSSFEMIFSME